jgi:hypothetical protein
MKKILLFLVVAVLCGVFVYADGTDSYDNYLAGTGAGSGLSTVTYSRRGATNVFVGPYAGTEDTTGSGNVAVGYGALRRTTTGQGNVALGYGAGGTATTGSGKLFIETAMYPTGGIYGDFNTGYFGVNNTSPTVALDITGSAKVSGTLAISGNVTGTVPIFAVISDTVLTDAQTVGGLWTALPIGGKYQVTLPTAAAGKVVSFMVADSDTLRIKAASGDSLILSGAAFKVYGSVAGDVKLICVDAVRWILLNAIGTWTGSVN